ncbi:MAG: hypothetical protein A4E32_01381 [Methanomassiliicoccales archaeon PtaU1.Bin124]|nr:MAG: hypothetical protein A4E32_01381 [Methanomassiliicoccales archaeon PtaU1.Bin124]
MVCLPQPAQLSVAQLNKIKALEKELGVVLIAVKAMEFADLTEAQIKDLQKVEKSTGAVVIAYK